MQTVGKEICAVCGGRSAESTPCAVCLLRGALSVKTFAGRSTIDTSSSKTRLYFDHYRVLRNDDGTPVELGRGAMGITYKAFDINLRCVVALKVINARILGDRFARRRFVREARAAASVRHANVASVFHLGRRGDFYYYAMEFVDGEGLDKAILRSVRLEASTALRVAAAVAFGLEAIAKQRLVHRDIKPSNIVVVSEGARVVNAKIIDLGLVKNTADDKPTSAISYAGSFIGTPAYGSPEQFAGVDVDIRSDLYSLGVTLWEMLSGQVPFQGSAAELSYKHQGEALPVERLKRCPRPIVALLVKLLEKDPSRRFQSPTDLLRAISKVREALDSGGCVVTNRTGSRAETIPARSDKSIRNWRPGLSGAKRFAPGKLVAPALGTAGLVLGYLLIAQLGPLLDRREDSPVERSIAVLPFDNIGGNQDDADFAEGVHDEVLNDLARIAQLRVVSRTSVMQYRRDSDLRQVATALGVTNVLEGTVRRNGNRVRVCMQLVDAVKDNMIWADSYDRDLTDVLAIQSEIAELVAAQVNARFKSETPERQREKPNQ